jgi:anti-sigma factor RsiW
MGTDMDHARCSELLPRYQRSELAPAEAAAVRSHLHGCEECSQELAGLNLLRAADVEPLTAEERDRIHGSIAAAVADEDTQTVIAPARRPLWHRLAPALAGVATLVVIVVAAVSLSGGMPGLESADDAGGSGESGADAGAPEAGGAEGTVRDDASLSTAFYAGDLGKVTVSSLSRDTRKRRFVSRAGSERDGATLGAAAEETTEPQAGNDASSPELSDASDQLRSLQAQADVAVGRQIADCARSVAAAVPYETVPVYAATATLEGDRVLLIGFNWTKSGGKKLGQFMLWAWPIGDCRIPVFYGSTTPPKESPE